MAGDSESVAEIAARFDARAAAYDESAMHRGLAAAVAEFASGADVDTVLDVATGTGLLLRALRPVHPVRLIGVDVSKGMLEVARSELSAAEFVQADAHALPLQDGSVDLVTCVTALHLFHDPEAALREWRRVLRPGGRAVTGTFAPSPGPDPVLKTHRGGSDAHLRFATTDALAGFAATAGFRLGRSTTWLYQAGTADQEACLIAELLPEPQAP